jgi:hypothetical protein
MTWHPDIPDEYRNQIVTGDVAKRIPDESVDLIFTDPVYDRIEDYRWLAETAIQKLMPDRSCLTFAPIGDLPRIHLALSTYLFYRWRIVLRPLFGYGSGQWLGRFRVSTKEVLWYEKGKAKLFDRLFDLQMISTFGYADFKVNGRVWQKHPNEVTRLIQALSPSGGVVLDTFTGSGTIPVACKLLGRNYIAFEIDPDTADLARDRVRNTQPPLPLVMPVQGELL